MITIIDYGAGNLRSVVNAVSKLGYRPKVTSSPEDVLNAQAVILPGVGAAADTMKNLIKLGLANSIRQFIDRGRPFFGICIGLQVLFSITEEGGWHECLDIIPGPVRKLPPGLKIPHMGWNQVKQKIGHPIFKDIPDGANFYFVHSYCVEPDDKALIVGETEYGITICSVIARGNLIATQFHPEKSGEFGLKLYSNFIKMALVAKTSSLQVNSLGEQ
ncbi:imidazole glycerol phosphate synthase subunit HisH [Chloroflexota bacterium]